MAQGNGSKFSLSKYLQLKFLVSVEDLTNLVSLASFLSAAPFVENLEIHVSTVMVYFLANITCCISYFISGIYKSKNALSFSLNEKRVNGPIAKKKIVKSKINQQSYPCTVNN